MMDGGAADRDATWGIFYARQRIRQAKAKSVARRGRPAGGACLAMGEQRGRGAARKVHRPSHLRAFAFLQPSSPCAGRRSPGGSRKS
jgi:hypothetical protein